MRDNDEQICIHKTSGNRGTLIVRATRKLVSSESALWRAIWRVCTMETRSFVEPIVGEHASVSLFPRPPHLCTFFMSLSRVDDGDLAVAAAVASVRRSLLLALAMCDGRGSAKAIERRTGRPQRRLHRRRRRRASTFQVRTNCRVLCRAARMLQRPGGRERAAKLTLTHTIKTTREYGNERAACW